MEDNTHTSKQVYVRQPRPSQTMYKPHETKRPQPTTRLYETKVPCGAAYIIWPRKDVSLNICSCQYCTPTKPNTFSTDHAPPRNTTSYRQAATNCSTLHQRRHFTARPLLLQPPRPPRPRFLHRCHRREAKASPRAPVLPPRCGWC